MTLSRIPARVLVLLPFMFGLPHGHAQTAAPAAPAVSSTLDVCLDSASGKYRYLDSVSVLGKGAPAGLAVDYRVQN